jgi:hypothetical protein
LNEADAALAQLQKRRAATIVCRPGSVADDLCHVDLAASFLQRLDAIEPS